MGLRCAEFEFCPLQNGTSVDLRRDASQESCHPHVFSVSTYSKNCALETTTKSSMDRSFTIAWKQKPLGCKHFTNRIPEQICFTGSEMQFNKPSVALMAIKRELVGLCGRRFPTGTTMRRCGLGAILLQRLVTSAEAVKRAAPLMVKQTAHAGRGVFATRDIADGELILSAEPFVSHPKLENVSRVCYYCLKEINNLQSEKPQTSYPGAYADGSCDDRSLSSFRGVGNSLGLEANFCSSQCTESAEKFMVVERQTDWSGLEHYCRENRLKFPLIARRLACMIVAGTAPADALDILSYPSLPNGRPSHWNDEHSLLIRSFQNAGIPPRDLQFLSKERYSEIISRLYINAFAVEIISVSPSSDLLEAAASSVSGQGSVGSAVYILPSMFNHDCDPNVDASWRGKSTIHLAARRDVSAGDELRITYLDSSMAYEARQELLKDSYGFLCECLRCQHRD